MQVVSIPEEVKNIPGRSGSADAELVFKVKLPALGYTTLLVQKTNGIFAF